MSQYLYEFEGFQLDPGRRILRGPDRQPIPLNPKALDTLLFLVTHPGELIDKRDLMDAVWPNVIVEENNLNKNISALRRVLGESPSEHRFIVTEPGRGYRFVAPVQHVDTVDIGSGTRAVEALTRPRVEASAVNSGAGALAGDTVLARAFAGLGALRYRYLMTGAAVIALVAGSAFYLGGSIDRRDSVAVLSFEGERLDEDAVLLADGIRDRLIRRLSQIDGLSVKSRAALREGGEDLQALARQLGVDALLLGRTARRGEALEIVPELVRPSDGTILWTEQYVRSNATILNIDGEIALAVARNLGVDLSEGELANLNRPRAASPAAYGQYLRGRGAWNQRTKRSLRAAERYFENAIRIDPNFAGAYAGLADTYLMLSGWGHVRPAEAAPLIVEMAETARALDPSLAEPHATLGYLITMQILDWERARQEFLTAIEKDNEYSTAHHWYAFFLLTQGQREAAIEEILLARESEPLSPIIAQEVGYFYVFAEQYEKAIDELERALELSPNHPQTLGVLARAHALAGQHDQARAVLERWRPLARDTGLIELLGARIMPMLGLENEARAIYEKYVERSRDEFVAPGLLGLLAAALGDLDAAFAHFEAGLDDQSLILSHLRDPTVAHMRVDDRYVDLMRRVGLEP